MTDWDWGWVHFFQDWDMTMCVFKEILDDHVEKIDARDARKTKPAEKVDIDKFISENRAVMDEMFCSPRADQYAEIALKGELSKYMEKPKLFKFFEYILGETLLIRLHLLRVKLNELRDSNDRKN